MDDDLGNPPLWAFLLTLAALVLACVVEVRLRAFLVAYMPPQLRWLPVLMSVPVGFAVLIGMLVLAGMLYDLL
jgi:hypothetical protein